MAEAKVEIQKEMVYTVPLKYAWLGPHNDRTRKAVDILKKFIKRHMKVKEVKIAAELNEKIWERGMKNPPRRIKVRAAKISEDVAWVTLPEHKFPFEVEKEEEKVAEVSKEEKEKKAEKVEGEEVKEEKKETSPANKAEKLEGKTTKVEKGAKSKPKAKKEEKSGESEEKGKKTSSARKKK